MALLGQFRQAENITGAALPIKRQAAEVVDILWSYVTCGRLE